MHSPLGKQGEIHKIRDHPVLQSVILKDRRTVTDRRTKVGKSRLRLRRAACFESIHPYVAESRKAVI